MARHLKHIRKSLIYSSRWYTEYAKESPSPYLKKKRAVLLYVYVVHHISDALPAEANTTMIYQASCFGH